MRTLIASILLLGLLNAMSFAATPPEHVGLRDAIRSGDYAKARAFIKMGVKDVYCGDMPADSAKALWSKRWKEDPVLAWEKCHDQYIATIPAAGCDKSGTYMTCVQRLSEPVKLEAPEDFLVLATAALSNQSIRKYANSMATNKRKKCKANFDFQRVDRCMISSLSQFVESEYVVNHLPATWMTWPFKELTEEKCKKDPCAWSEVNVWALPFIVGQQGERALEDIAKKAAIVAFSADEAALFNEWMSVLRKLQGQFKIFGKTAPGEYPGGKNWAKHIIDNRMKSTGTFSEMEVNQLCLADSSYAAPIFEQFTDYRCPMRCGDYYRRYSANGCDDRLGLFVDARDGMKYASVKIGSQIWMAQNLNYDYQINGETYGNKCYEDNAGNCSITGRQYTWGASMDSALTGCGKGEECEMDAGMVKGICPDGWHLPDTAEWNALFAAVAVDLDTAGTALKTAIEWFDDRIGYVPGTNSSGFSALPSGNGSSYMVGRGAYFWSSAEHTYYRTAYDCAYSMSLSHTSATASIDCVNKESVFGIRCVKDDK